MTDDFVLIQIKAGEMLKNRKDFVDVATEIEDVYLEKDEVPSDNALETNQLLYKCLKGHAIDLIVRCNSKKRTYMDMIWEEQKIDQLFGYVLSDVYLDSEQEKSESAGRGLEFGQYLSGLLTLLKKKLDNAVFKEGEKEKLVVERFLMLGMDQASYDDGEKAPILAHEGCQATAQMKENSS